MILTYERARDTLSIIEGFLDINLNHGADFDADPPHFEVVFNDSLETIVVLVRGITYMMQVGSDDDCYKFDRMTDDDALPPTITIPFREITKLEWGSL